MEEYFPNDKFREAVLAPLVQPAAATTSTWPSASMAAG